MGVSLRWVGESPGRRGVIQARVDIPGFGEVTLRDVVIMSTRWWADFMSGISVLVGEKALRPVLYYSAYRMMKQHDQKGIVPFVEEISRSGSGGTGGPDEVFEVAGEVFSALGFGRILEFGRGDGYFTVVVADSFEARGRRSAHPVCHFVAGILAALIEDTMGLRIGPVIEERCAAAGAEACVFRAEIMGNQEGGKGPRDRG